MVVIIETTATTRKCPKCKGLAKKSCRGCRGTGKQHLQVRYTASKKNWIAGSSPNKVA